MLANAISSKIFIFKMAEKDNTTKFEYLLAMARDIHHMKESLEQQNENWSNSISDVKEAERISKIYLEYKSKEKNVA